MSYKNYKMKFYDVVICLKFLMLNVNLLGLNIV